jgi:hypothetical protein
MTPGRTTEEKEKYGKKENKQKQENQDVEINSMKNNCTYSITLQ